MRWIVGLLLIVAALLRAVQLVSEPAAALMSPLDRSFLPMQVGVELAVGLLVLSGLYWRQFRWLPLLLFTAFATYSCYLALAGAASCGWFGPIKLHPWWAFLLDLAVVLGLLIMIRGSRHIGPEGPRPKLYWARQAIPAMIVSLSVLSTAFLVRYGDCRTATADGLLTTARNREWFVHTPVEIQLVDGPVTGASTELSALLSSAER